MIKQNQTLFPILALCILAGAIILTMALLSPPTPLPAWVPGLAHCGDMMSDPNSSPLVEAQGGSVSA